MKIACCIAAAFLFLSAHVAVGAREPANASQHLSLLGRADDINATVALSESDWRWLRTKRVLRLGTTVTDPPPFSLTYSVNEYEGVTADYAELLSDLLWVEVDVSRYEDKAHAVEALKRGEIDFLGTASGFVTSDPGLVTSHSYAREKSVFIVRRDRKSTLPAKLEGERVATSKHFQPVTRLKANYPQSILNVYPTDFEAISSVLFGKSDVYIGGELTSRYLISRNLFNELQLQSPEQLEVNDISFSLRANDNQLLRIINQALDSIPASENIFIMRRWGRNAHSEHGLEKFNITLKERRWLDRHRKVRVAVNEDIPPIAFFTKGNQLSGIDGDILEEISSLTGLQFEVVRGSTTNDLENLVRTGKADFMMGFSQNSNRESDFRFTRPYLTTPYVLITRNLPHQPLNLSEMTGKRLALSFNNFDLEYIRQQYPTVQLVDASGTVDAMEKVTSGIADAAISHLIRAHHLVANSYQDKIKIVGIVGEQPAKMGIATAKGSDELYSILEKAITSIAPEEMDRIINNWRGEVMVDNSVIRGQHLFTIRSLAIGTALLILALSWIFYLRRLIKRRTEVEIALNEQMEFMRVLMNGLPYPIYVRDSHTRMLFCNSKYLELLGCDLDDIIGTRPTSGLSIEAQYSVAYEQQYFDVMASGKELVRDCEMMMPNGKLSNVHHWVLPFRNSAGEVKGIIGGWIDISEREHLLRELKNAKIEADEANRAKTSFLATMSHEIRTPMNAVVGMLELAMKKAEQGILDRFAIEVASGAAQGMLELIGDILDVVRIESGKLTLNPHRAALKELVESVIRVFEGLAQQKQLTLVLDFDDQADRDVLIDSIRFKQILSNLLSNSIKFTAKGEVQVSVRGTYYKENESIDIHVSVRDTGIGISLEDQARLFTAFSQAKAENQLNSGGAGLGLMISRTLCSMMQGELILSSVPGLGTLTEIKIKLPILLPLPPSKNESANLVPTRQLNVLVIDDHPANRLLLSQQLSYLGHNVCDEEDGIRGLQSWRNNRFDVVITDCNMPLMNGYELAKAIRAEEANTEKQACIIYGFTANAQLEEIDRCLEAGMDDCLFKPMSMQNLRDCLLKVESVFVQPRDYEGDELLDDSIDIAGLVQLSSGNREFVKSLLHDLELSNDQDLRRLIQLFSENDLEGMSELAHRIKGSARIIKARRLIQCCDILQVSCNGLDPNSVTRSVDALHEAMESLQVELRRYI